MNKIDQSMLNASRAQPGGMRGKAPPSDAADAIAKERAWRWPDVVLFAGVLALAIPTMVFVAKSSWSGEQGTHGPIILATGLWLIWHRWNELKLMIQPPPASRAWLPFLVMLPAYLIARITQVVEVEGYAMYGLVVAAFYAVVGFGVLKALAFPLAYLAFAFPPPEMAIYALTLPIKIGISEGAIAILQFFGYPIGGTGVTIQIGQYQLLVAAACSGLNSIVSLSALAIFYIYLMHRDEQGKKVILLLFVVPVAIAANFLRVLILILLTYYAGEAAAQGFLHDMAGITMFLLALGLILLIDIAVTRFWIRRSPPTREEFASHV